MRGEIVGIERRRRWSDEDKLAVVSAVGVNGATVTQVAQRHELTRQQIYAWRNELKRKGLWSAAVGMLFLPIDATPAAELPAISTPDPAPVIWVELQLAKGRMLRFPSSMDDKVLTRLIRTVDAA